MVLKFSWTINALKLIGIATLAVSAPSTAQTDGYLPGMIWNSQTTGNELSKICGKDWEPGYFDACGSYLTGVIDGLGWTSRICPPEGVQTRQLTTIAHKALWDDPTEWHRPAVLIVGRRLVSLYQCNLK